MRNKMTNLFMKNLRKVVSDFDFPFDDIFSSALFPKGCIVTHGGQHSTGDTIRMVLVRLLQHLVGGSWAQLPLVSEGTLPDPVFSCDRTLSGPAFLCMGSASSYIELE